MDAKARRLCAFVMATPRSRDRVTIDLCGIGDAARAAARMRGTTLALFACQALLAALPGHQPAMQPRAEPSLDLGGTIKLSVRLSTADSNKLAAQAGALGLSQARLVALLIRGAELPLPVAERRGEVAALRASAGEALARWRAMNRPRRSRSERRPSLIAGVERTTSHPASLQGRRAVLAAGRARRAGR